MSFNTSRLINKVTGQRLPTSISQFEAAFKSMRSLKPEVQPPFPAAQATLSPPISLEHSLSNPSNLTNWRYVRMRQARGLFYLRALMFACFITVCAGGKELRSKRRGFRPGTMGMELVDQTRIDMQLDE